METLRQEIELRWRKAEAILLEPTNVTEKSAKIVFQSIQPVAEFNQIQPPDKALHL